MHMGKGTERREEGGEEEGGRMGVGKERVVGLSTGAPVVTCNLQTPFLGQFRCFGAHFEWPWVIVKR